MFNFVRTHPIRTAGAAAVVVAGLAWLAFGFFGVHTLFIDDVVSEAAPVFDTPAVAAAPIDEPVASEESTIEPVAPVTSATPAEVTPDAGAPQAATSDTAAPDDGASPAPATPAAPSVELAGSFVGDAHPTSGLATVLGNGTGQRFLRFEDFETDNGPDLDVYLVNSSTGDVSDYVDLGDLKGNIGEQNYEIPEGIDLDVYDQVVIWCVRFGVGFGNAPLTPT